MLGFLGQLKSGPESTGEQSQTSDSFEQFIKTPEAKQFVDKWASKKNEAGQPLYTKRGITRLLGALHRKGNSEEKVLSDADDILAMLGGMDGLKGFLAGWKASTEGLVKALKQAVGSK